MIFKKNMKIPTTTKFQPWNQPNDTWLPAARYDEMLTSVHTSCHQEQGI